MYITILERFGDFDLSYPVAVYITDKPFDLKAVKDEFKTFFNINIVDNSTQTMDVFIEFIRKNYGYKPHKFKSYTIAED
jgi:hypothetical protein